ncbi:MAG: hypothetical protein WDW38_010361 [Sanguina aurantia]
MSDLASQTSSQTPVGSSSLGKDEPASAIGRNSGSFSDDDPTFSIVAFFKFAGPGIIMCTAFIDPGDLEADLQAGAQYRYMLLWIYLWATVLGYIMSMLSAKLGVASGRDMGTLCREEYPKWVRIVLWLVIEVSLMGVEIQYVIGAGVGLSLLCAGTLPLWAAVLICGALAYLTLMLDRYGIKAVEAVFLILIAVMVISFAILAVKAQAPADEVLLGLAWPQLPMQVPGSDYNSPTTDLVAGGIIGGAMSPYNFYFFSMLVLKRELPMASRGEKRIALTYYAIEAAIALFLALFMNVCIVSSFASAFYDTDQAADAGFLNAGDMLGDMYGKAFGYIWALGLFATGLSSTTAAVYAGQAIMSGFIDIKIESNPLLALLPPSLPPIPLGAGVYRWRAVVTRSIAIVPALVVAATQRQDQTELDTLNLWLNLLQTIALPFALLPLLHFTCNKRIMGKYWANGIPLTILASIIAAFSVLCALYTTIESTPLPSDAWAVAVASLGVAVYAAAVLYLAVSPDRVQRWLAALRERLSCCGGSGSTRVQEVGDT